ncbi:MAG: hypothetical protein A3D28_00295 [Omnitrophica bacterium RIFCSPHIGHO2_02_FULL_63_14]|nr:MAG: hypothetical protein A3D28_00295 [Omnitrophica bacterium RIFCSPHIGHO2_02_FULL_63_14]
MRLFTFNRAIADRLGPALARTPLTPNHLTTLALGSGLAAGWFMAQAGRPGLLAGAFFLHLSFLLDNCDGMVARIKGTSSAAGMWYDRVADLAVDAALWAGLAAGAVRQGVTPWVWALAAPAMIGSFVHFLQIDESRREGKAPRPAGNAFASSMDSLSGDGDPSVLVWIMALIGYPGYLLLAGAVYMLALWVYSVRKN